jgi:hypothetical protein
MPAWFIMRSFASKVPTAANAQQLPQPHWFLAGVTTPVSAQLYVAGNVAMAARSRLSTVCSESFGRPVSPSKVRYLAALMASACSVAPTATLSLVAVSVEHPLRIASASEPSTTTFERRFMLDRFSRSVW